MRSDFEYCKTTKKFIYTSEAQARRAVNKYDEIRRYYKCENCEGYHTTSDGVARAIKKGFLTQEQVDAKKGYKHLTPKQIEERLKELRNES